MNHTTRTQDLREAFSSIITMMLGLLRARGLRGLLQLPTLWLVSRELRRMAERFNALLDAFRAGTLPPVAPPITAPDRGPAPAPSARVATRSAAPRGPRTRPARIEPARASRRVRAPYRDHPTPNLLPAPLGIVRATAEQKNPSWPPCLRMSNSLRIRNVLGNRQSGPVAPRFRPG